MAKHEKSTVNRAIPEDIQDSVNRSMIESISLEDLHAKEDSMLENIAAFRFAVARGERLEKYCSMLREGLLTKRAALEREIRGIDDLLGKTEDPGDGEDFAEETETEAS